MTSTGSSIGEFEISRDGRDYGRPRDLARTQTVMEVSLCPMCTRALKIYTIEPHPTRDGVDVVTYRCPIDGGHLEERRCQPSCGGRVRSVARDRSTSEA